MELGYWVEARPHLRSQTHCHKEAPTILIFKMFTMIVSGMKVSCQRKGSPIQGPKQYSFHSESNSSISPQAPRALILLLPLMLPLPLSFPTPLLHSTPA